MDADLQEMTIGGLAAGAGVNVETVRYYQRRGLLAVPDKPRGSIRRYGASDIARVAFVKAAQRLGFSLDEIATLLSLDDGTHCREARELGQHKLDEVRAKVADLRKIEAVLSRLVRGCGGRRSKVSCPLIASLQRR